MADLEAVFPRGRGRRIRSIIAGLGILLAGLVLLTLGGAKIGTELLVGAGVPRAAATQMAFASVGTIPPLVFAVTLAITTSKEPTRLLGLGGVILALVGIAVGLPFGFGTVAPIVIGLYGIGLFLAVSAVVTGLLEEESSKTTPSVERSWEGSDTVEMFRSPSTNRLPADGSGEEEDLSFPLDEEE